MQLAGAGGASFVAGCGGGGGEESPTATATEATGQDTPTATEAGDMDTPTATEADEDTPTETEEMETPTGQTIEIVPQTLRNLTITNYEQANPNPWDTENGYNPGWQNTQLAWVPEAMQAPPNPEQATDVILPGLAKSMEVDFSNNTVEVELNEISWGDGTACDVDSVFGHWDLVAGQIEMGEASESALPLSWEANDDLSFSAQLLPGNTQIRLFEAFFQGTLVSVENTHPDLHSEWIEGVRDATTTSALQSNYQSLVGAQFENDAYPTMSNGPFIATNWNPDRMDFEVRENYPWGLGTGLEVDQMFQGVTQASTTTDQLINAAQGGQAHLGQVAIRRSFERFSDNWEIWDYSEATGSALWFQPKEPFGARTEESRNLRKGVISHFDNSELAAINDLAPAYEQSMGFWRERDFNQWVGDVYDDFTQYGDGTNGYSNPQQGDEYFRAAGYEKNRNGLWRNDDGVLEAEVILGMNTEGGVTRPVLENNVTQLNDMGIRATGRLVQDTQYDNATEQREGDMQFSGGNCEMHPHPYFGYREDCGIGSTQGLPVSLWWGDWHNGYRRVEVPMPIGNQDGPLTTYDWNRNALGINQLEENEMDGRIEELSWVLNQWVPGIFAIRTTAFPIMNTDVIQPTAAWGDPTEIGRSEDLYSAGDIWGFTEWISTENICQLIATGMLEPA